MSFRILETPATRVSINNVSYWGAAFNPQVFLYERRDEEFQTIEADGLENLKITQRGQDYTEAQVAGFIGTMLFVNTPQQGQFTAEILSVNFTPETPPPLSFPSEMEFIVKAPDAANRPTESGDDLYFNSHFLHPNYRFRTTLLIEGKRIVAYHTPNAVGLCRADLSIFLKSFTENEDNLIDYNVLTTLDVDRFTKYKTEIIEDFGDGVFGEPAEPNAVYYVSHSALQFGRYGSNMAQFTPFLNEPNDDKKAKFLTDAKQPELTVGYPFDLAFIMPEEFIGKTVYCRYATLDVNGQQINGLSSSAILYGIGSALLINATDLLLASNNTAPSFAINVNTGINRLVLFDSFVDQVKFVDLYLYWIDGTTERRITEIKRISIKSTCQKKPVYLKWLNRLGGFNYFMFDDRSTFSFDVIEAQFVDRPVLDYAKQNATQDVLYKRSQEKITIGKNGLTADQMRTLAAMLVSTKVYYLSEENPRQWLTVIIDQKNSDLNDNRYLIGDFETVIKLPEQNNLTA